MIKNVKKSQLLKSNSLNKPRRVLFLFNKLLQLPLLQLLLQLLYPLESQLLLLQKRHLLNLLQPLQLAIMHKKK